jgi:putative phosphoribosyl transferase
LREIDAMFLNRREAGKQLAHRLTSRLRASDAVVLGLPTGGMPVAYEIARAFPAPLNPFLVRPVRVPQRRDLTVGFVSSGGTRILDWEILRREHLSPAEAALAARLRETDLTRREHDYLAGAQPVSVRDRTALLVNDGMLTGATMRTAILALRQREPAKVFVAVPVASPRAIDTIRDLADDVFCLWTPLRLESIELCYEYYAPTSDGEVRELLALAREKEPRFRAPFSAEDAVTTP